MPLHFSQQVDAAMEWKGFRRREDDEVCVCSAEVGFHCEKQMGVPRQPVMFGELRFQQSETARHSEVHESRCRNHLDA